MENSQIPEVQKETARTAIEGISKVLDTYGNGKFQTEGFQRIYKLITMSSVNKIWNGAKDALKLATENFIEEDETLIGLKINNTDWPISAYFDESNPPKHPKILTGDDLKRVYLSVGGRQEQVDQLFKSISQ